LIGIQILAGLRTSYRAIVVCVALFKDHVCSALEFISTASHVIPPTVYIDILLSTLLGVSSDYVAQAPLATTAVLYTFVIVLPVTEFGMAVLERPDGILDDATLF